MTEPKELYDENGNVTGWSVPMPCQALIDQNRFIGEDPVGHSCSNDAIYRNNTTGYRLCQDCYDALDGKGPHAGRVTYL